MKYAIISGSHRDDSVAQSYKIAKWLAEAISSKSADAKTDIISLGGNPYPLWDQSAWDGGSELAQQMKPVLERITQAEAIILIAPEWGGMVPGGLKNFLIYVSSAHAAHKPALLVGVSGSRGGTYPIAELRMSGYKNSRMVYIPDHLIVTSAEKVMNDHDLENGDAADVYIKNRAHYSLDVLAAYAKALKGMREAGNLLDESYPFGM